MKKCTTCGELKELTEFQKLARNKDGHTNTCKVCKRAYDNAHYKAHPERRGYIMANRSKAKIVTSQFVYDYMLANPCVDCGETDPIVLQFDHLDPSQKTYNVSNMRGHSVASVEAEIAKCEVVCANCHARRTAKQFGWYSNIL